MALYNLFIILLLKINFKTLNTLTAIDTLDTIVSKKVMPKVEKAYHKTDKDSTRTAGLGGSGLPLVSITLGHNFQLSWHSR